MKKQIRLLILAVLALALCFGLTACGEKSAADRLPEVAPDAQGEAALYDDDTVVATVGDYNITLEEYKEEYAYFSAYYDQMYQAYYGMGIGDMGEEALLQLQDDVLENLIFMYTLDHKAKEQGLDTLTAEEEQAAEAEVAASMQSLEEEVEAALQEELSLDPTLDAETLRKELLSEIIYSYVGYDMTLEELEAYWSDMARKDAIRMKVQDAFYAEVTLSEEELNEYYQQNLAADEEEFGASPDLYGSAEESYEIFGGAPILYAPEGYIRVKHILIAPEEELDTAYADLNLEMEELQLEAGTLLLEDEQANAAKLAQLKQSYAEKKARQQNILDTHFAPSKAKAEEAYNKLQAGTSFDEVLKAYTSAYGYSESEVIAEKGQLFYKPQQEADVWTEEIRKAVLALSDIGAYTGIVRDVDGYHILQYVGEEPAGPKALDAVRTELYEAALSAKQAEEWDAVTLEWTADPALVQRYPEAIRSVR